MQVVKEPVIEFTIGPAEDCLIIRVTRTEAERLLERLQEQMQTVKSRNGYKPRHYHRKVLPYEVPV